MTLDTPPHANILLSMIQHGVTASMGEPGLGIGKSMDWVEAGLEAVKARQEEESEEQG